MKRAQNLDPLSLIIDTDLVELLALAHSYANPSSRVARQSKKNLIVPSHTIKSRKHTSKST
jgi:hypothetical protein